MPDFISKDVGLLVEKENISELRNAILKILNNEVKFDPDILAKYAKDNYRQDLFIDELINVYLECKN